MTLWVVGASPRAACPLRRLGATKPGPGRSSFTGRAADFVPCGFTDAGRRLVSSAWRATGGVPA
jgi:hypothetical protein